MIAAMTALKRWPGRRALFPEALPDPEGEAVAAIASLRFSVTLADRSKTIDLTMLSGRRALARSFAGALWRACQVGGPAGSISTASAYANALKTFWRYLDAVSPHVVRLSDVSAACIDGFDAWMEESGLHPNHRLHRMSKVLNLLRLAEAAEPGRLPPDASRRLMYTSDRPGVRARPRDAYGDDIAKALRTAARTDLAAIIRRFADADRMPTVEDAFRSSALAAAHEAAMAAIDAEGVIGHRHPLFKRLYTLRRESGLPNDRLIHDLHGRRHLLAADLVSLIVLVSLDTGLEIEAIKDLRADCLKNPAGGYVEIEYCKRRARGAEWKRLRVRDGGSSTPGGLIRKVLQWTGPARDRLGADTLWVHYAWGRLIPRVLGMKEPVASWTRRHDIRDEQDQPLRLNLTRLRKTHKAAWYRRTGGQLERFAVGHSTAVAANHYADIPALRHIHEATIADAMSDALDAALRPCVLSPDEEAAVRVDPDHATGLPISGAAAVTALLRGEQDVWLASCGGFYASPFGPEGEACPSPFWGCLECSNAVITARKLPALLSFLSFIRTQRQALTEADWTTKFGRVHGRIADQILPRFSEAEIDEARQAAAADPRLIYLPPEAGAP
ncbi:hypothetical protein ACVW1C_008354 [Bradyrhizobium sp. USDA 4011]|jgi:hypothetical protein|uniref:hypothetical protein n=1 Tax=Bosea sp. AS-1 TaxID=2015316 RepID=UPI000B790197|nr:hypothetical protein [Bosea sp. AS-1]RTM15414.1 MAG: hypothetical protein EKK33_00110 [Bradyrhizobiaceae bacterium]CAH1696616.1 conserved hypothetical protein [Hyphomicrobiales bacterium]CAH1696641.1 conserved hypothetical protein [Hyphomicrobiales bacterium]